MALRFCSAWTCAAAAQLLMGCGDGTVRLWEPGCAKAARATRSLRFCHAQYVGWLRVTSQYALSCSRDGELQLWRQAWHSICT